MNDDRVLAHLSGYAAIAVVLASANWSGPIGSLVGGMFGLAIAVILVRTAIERTRASIRREAERIAGDPEAAADGGFDFEEGSA